MANAANTVHFFLKTALKPYTLAEIKAETGLKSNEISMALCYLRRQGYLSRKLTKNNSTGRKQIWAYIYHSDRSAEQ
jgi:predicted transcriptional regulator